ncbi:putative hydro-lyase [bioreactor metagenome]|uniref:Putative hydro-lyase n=1 Tax=bioreactor metagenome TaxID=1076179 RepID=A0A644TSA7_9ZZZZ
MDYLTLSPVEMRAAIRNGEWRRPTAGLAAGFAQANLVVLPKELAFEFLLFCQRNPKPCPVLDVTDVGSPEPKLAAPGADLRTEIPKYRIYKKGVYVEEVTNLSGYWRNDLVAFLLGCSFSFESSMLRADVPVRHIEEDCNVPMYITNIDCKPAGMFKGPLVVSMRPLPPDKVVKSVQITSRFPAVHGAPVHIGDPAFLGIKELGKPDFGDAVTVKPGETPVFWACGCTPQAVAMEAKPEFMITHAPGHMFITDIRDESIATL